MSQILIWSRRATTTLLASVVATGAMTLTGGVTTASASPTPEAAVLKETPTDTLGSHDLKLLAEAQAKGEKEIMLIVATDKGKAGDVARRLRGLGGYVARQVNPVGYVRAQVPTGAVIRAAKLPGVAAIDLNESIPLSDPTPESKEGVRTAPGATRAGPGADTPAANPFMPTHETGAVAFTADHSEWDGRGVTIGIMDSGVTLDHPALRTTTTGERKIVDWFTATDPILDGDATWRAMLTEVTGPSFGYANARWTAPAGTWLINLFAESITSESDPGGDVNRDGDTTDTFGILYDPVTNDIRVDANQNRDFTDDPVMRPYGERFDIGRFGTDDPDTAERDQMPFVVEYREDVDLSPFGGQYVGQKADFVNIGIVESAHGSHVAGIAAANDMLGNAAFDGAAPGAKLVSARACSWGGACTAAALTDGMVDLVVNRGVDVVNMSIGGLPALNDGNNARAQLYDRLIADYGVQIFISAGNSGPGVNTVSDPSVASDVVSVAAAISKDTWLANYGSTVRRRYDLFTFSSRGPREDGGFKPNITAPGSAISTTPLWQAGTAVPEAGYALPPGYGMFNGTSMSAPQATGAAALLLSAAKATDRGVSPAALRRAIYSSARWIDGVPAHGQGNGRFNVNGAWQLLRVGVKTRAYTVQAPVCTPISEFLARPNQGTGVHNRCAAGAGGQKAGKAKTYQVKLTRTSGPSGRIMHDLDLVGDTGAFTSVRRRVGLALNKTVTVPVRVKAGAGVHSAILRVDDPNTPAVDFEIMNTVVVATGTKAPAYSFSTEGTVDRNSFQSHFVTVPEDASALQLNLSGIATGSQVRFIAINPFGELVESNSSLNCFTNFSDPDECEPQERDYADPIPGVWEIEVEARRTSPALANPYQLRARIQGAEVSPAVVDLPSVTVGESTPVTWDLTNTFGPVTVSGQGGPLGSATISRPTIGNREVLTYQVEVPAGATLFDVRIGNASDLDADLDLFVRRSGVLIGQSANGGSEESVSLIDPAPGVYTIEVDGHSVPAGSTRFDYQDVFFSTELGEITVASTAVTLANGGSATISGSATAETAPAAGRQLLGGMVVVTDEGAVVGSGNVSIGSVDRTSDLIDP